MSLPSENFEVGDRVVVVSTPKGSFYDQWIGKQGVIVSLGDKNKETLIDGNLYSLAFVNCVLEKVGKETNTSMDDLFAEIKRLLEENKDQAETIKCLEEQLERARDT